MPEHPPPPPPMSPPPLGHESQPQPGSLGHCPSCGTEILYCSHCGAPLDQHATAQPPSATPPGVRQMGGAVFNVVLHDAGRQKIEVIKEIRAATGLGLAEAKDLVERAGAGAIVVTGVDGDHANAIVTQLTVAGALATAVPAQPAW